LDELILFSSSQINGGLEDEIALRLTCKKSWRRGTGGRAGRREKRDLGTVGQYVGVGYNFNRKETVRVCVGASFTFLGKATAQVPFGWAFPFRVRAGLDKPAPRAS
jgi:hypothetical protein